MKWAVSQAVSLRRMHVRGDLVLHQNHGWASGGWMSDSLVDGNVDSGSQQQWISRNCDWKSWTGANWNMVFVGVVHPPEGAWPLPPYTKSSADACSAREVGCAGPKIVFFLSSRPPRMTFSNLCYRLVVLPSSVFSLLLAVYEAYRQSLSPTVNYQLGAIADCLRHT